MHLALLGARRTRHRAIGTICIRALAHGLDALSARGFALSTEAHALFHSVHSFARVAALLAGGRAFFTVVDAFLHRYFHLHAGYYAG
jgi:hypothetical protein